MLKHVCTSVTLLVLAVAACATVGFAADKKSPGPSTAPSTQPVNKMCAVEKDDKADPTVTVVYKGKVIAFCCEDCKPKFEKDPEKYMKDLK